MIDPGWFRPIYVTTHIWQTTGFVAVFYIATIAGINPELYEAATIDGAGRFGCMRHVTLPSLVPAIGGAADLQRRFPDERHQHRKGVVAAESAHLRSGR